MDGLGRRAALVCGFLAVTAPALARFEPKGTAHPEAVVVMDQARFTVLTPTLLRLEYAPDGVFEDRPSLLAVVRALPVPPFTRTQDGGALVIETERLRLRYGPNGEPFSPANLRIEVLGPQDPVRWTPGTPNEGNLGGTVRTLDGCRGPLDLGEGVLSTDGWYLLDDSASVVLEGEPRPWPTPRPEGERTDWYFFGYGRDYATALSDLTAVGGEIPLPPRFTFGSWYSRYWPYSSEDFLAIADGYHQRGYPLDVMVIDMDWHLAGWTGYTWNRTLIPDPQALLDELHERGLKVTLNLHPHSGVGSHEAAYPAFARAMGVDPAGKQRIPFDIADPRYVESYFKLLHHPLEAQGVDFWWVDWQQEHTTKIAGLDPLPWLNHLHFHDRGREGTGRRCLAFSRWGGWGNHRYPIQFSGDTESTWEVLRFLATFTSTAGNVGAAFWSHDLGGHWSSTGRIDAELYARWLQLGAFSASMRVHSTRDPANDRRPWIYGDQFEQAAHAAYDLRYRLLPYVYTMARRTHDTGLPLNRPMYLHHPDEPEAYQQPGQFYFGDDLIVAPAAEPGRGPGRMVDVEVWLPEGDWYDLTTHMRYEGPGEVLAKVPLDRIPAFVRGGRPIPMHAPGRLNTREPLDPLVVRVYPGPAGETVLYEDDGVSPDYRQPDGFSQTRLTFTPSTDPQEGGFELLIHPADGSYRGMPAARDVIVEVGRVPGPLGVEVNGRRITGAAQADQPGVAHDPDALLATVRLPRARTDARTAVRFLYPAGLQEAFESPLVTLEPRVADWQVQASVEHPADVPTQRQQEVAAEAASKPSAERAAALAARLAEARVLDLLEHTGTLPEARRGPAVEALLGAALRLSIDSTGNGALRVAGQLWLDALPVASAVTGTVSLTGGSTRSQTAPVTQVAFDAPGKRSFAFDLPLDPTRVQDVVGTVEARLDWSGVPLTLSRAFAWNKSYLHKWWVAAPFPGGKGPRAEQHEPETNADLNAEYTARAVARSPGSAWRWARAGPTRHSSTCWHCPAARTGPPTPRPGWRAIRTARCSSSCSTMTGPSSG